MTVLVEGSECPSFFSKTEWATGGEGQGPTCRRGLAGTCVNSGMLRKARDECSERPLDGRTCTELGAQNEGDFQQSRREEQTRDHERPRGVC